MVTQLILATGIAITVSAFCSIIEAVLYSVSQSQVEVMAQSKRVEGGDEGSVVEPPRALVTALRRLLRPLVRALLHQQIQYPQLAALLKSLYIDVARREFSLGRKSMTVNPLSSSPARACLSAETISGETGV